jgi:hypothetical protein
MGDSDLGARRCAAVRDIEAASAGPTPMFAQTFAGRSTVRKSASPRDPAREAKPAASAVACWVAAATRREQAAIDGRNPTVLAELDASFAVIGDAQLTALGPGHDELRVDLTSEVDRLRNSVGFRFNF